MTNAQLQPSAPVSTIPHHPAVHVDGERCPWCEQPIAHEKFQQIRARIKQEEQERVAVVEQRLRGEALQQIATKDIQHKAALEDAQRASAAALEKAREESALREAKAIEDATKLVTSTMQEQLTRVQQEKSVLQAAKVAAEQQLQESKVTQQRQVEEQVRAEGQKVREALEQAHVQDMNQLRAKAFDDQLKLQSKIEELSRQVQKQTAEDLGEGAEVDLYESLRGAFEDDRIKRIERGVPGADIWHDVVYNGEVCGRIVYDSKNRSAWRSDYVTKLQDDQRAAEANHAILATRVFPAGKQQVHVQHGVLIANPARVVALVELLREHIIQVHRLRLSGQARERKVEELYTFINSDHCRQLLGRVEEGTDSLLDLDVKEKSAHDQVWKKRGEIVKTIQKAEGDLRYQVNRIVEGGQQDEQ